VRVAVRDTGVGIAPEDHAAVFEQFQQVGDTLTEKPQGTGLGLPICKQIVEHHGGRLWLESALGEGSTFAFTLPALRPVHATAGESAHGSAGQPGAGSVAALEAGVRLRRRVEAVLAAGVRGAPLPPSSRAAASGGSADPVRSPATVLVVDDDPHVRGLLRHALEEDGHEVLEAGDGVSALAIVRSRPPDLVVLDVMMPHLSGFDVVAARNGDLGRRDAPVVILSVVDDAGRGYRLGVERYLTKPVDVSTLVSDVAALARPSGGPDGSVDGACVALVDDATGEAGERSLALRAEAAIANAGYRVVRVASVAAAARLEPAATVVVMTRAVAERDDGLALLRREERLRDAAVVVHP
jgi:CheY-like chemotaxis protein